MIYRHILSWRVALLAPILALLAPDARAGIQVANQPNGVVQVSIDVAPQVLAQFPAPSSNYKLCWEKNGQANFICNVNQSYSTTNPTSLSGFVAGREYRMVAWCWCVTGGPLNIQHQWVSIGSYVFTYMPPPPTLLSSTTVRLRSGIDQCAYGTSGGNAHHWTCWTDPNMKFVREDYSNGTTKFRHVQTNLCLWGSYPGTPIVKTTFCGYLGTEFQVLNGTVAGSKRLVIPVTKGPNGPMQSGFGGCLFAYGGDGDVMRKGPCVVDPKFNFFLDPA